VFIGDVQLAEGGVIPPAYFEDDALIEKARAQMRASEIAIYVKVGDGHGRSRAMGCDLSYEYVRINGEYTT
jgi:glutamate N-acetyltransferase / amino-acid N-acetyltransferase